MRTYKSLALASTFVLTALAALPAHAERTSNFDLKATAELGFLGVIDHNIQFGSDGTDFDYDAQGAQDNLYAVSRYSLDLRLARRHELTFLYQPLELKTSDTLERDLRVDGVTFPAGTAMNFTYGFPFYRASYMYDFADNPRHELALGASMQIRNATIEFSDLAGKVLVSKRNIGPVPLLKLRARYGFASGAWIGTEIDGAYAPISYINGRDPEVTGALIDASARIGVPLGARVNAFLNLRYLAGGAVGTSEADGLGDGYTRNWLHFFTTTIGFELDVMDL